jgi:anti-anti-sigma factor
VLDVTLVPAPDQVVVRITGDADLSTAPLIADGLARAAGLGTRQVVVDAAGVSFWDCSGLHELCTFTATLCAAGRSCRIAGAPAATRLLIGVANLAGRLDLDGPVRERPTPPVRPRTRSTVRGTSDPLPADVLTGVPARRTTSGHPVPVRSRWSATRTPVLSLRRRG